MTEDTAKWLGWTRDVPTELKKIFDKTYFAKDRPWAEFREGWPHGNKIPFKTEVLCVSHYGNKWIHRRSFFNDSFFRITAARAALNALSLLGRKWEGNSLIGTVGPPLLGLTKEGEHIIMSWLAEIVEIARDYLMTNNVLDIHCKCGRKISVPIIETGWAIDILTSGGDQASTGAPSGQLA